MTKLLFYDHLTQPAPGFDPALERPVSLRLIPAQDELAAAAEVAARQAATVDDRRVIAVLDILTAEAVVGAEVPSAATYLVIVSEWVDGRTLTDIYEEREGEPGLGSIWTWTAIDADSRLVLTWYLGDRDLAFCVRRARRLAEGARLTDAIDEQRRKADDATRFEQGLQVHPSSSTSASISVDLSNTASTPSWAQRLRTLGLM